MTNKERLNCLTDRPCEACKFHESGRCERWNCVFEEKPDDVEDCEDAISRQAALDELKELDDQDLYLPFHFKLILDELPSVTPKQKMCFDGMTNGEVIGLLFQNTDIYHTYHNQNFMLRELVFTDEWWNAPYKEESEDKE